MSTKQRSLLTREDITENYKHELEGEEQLKAAIQKALSKVGHEYTSYFLQQDESHIEIVVQPDGELLLGHPFKVNLIVKNISADKSHDIRVVMRTYSATYNGRNRVVIKEEENKLSLAPKSEKQLPSQLHYKEYSPHLRPQATLITSVFGHVAETDFEMYYENLFHLAQPSMKFKTSEGIKIGVETVVEAYFKNPLPIPIPEGVFLLEMPRQNTTLVQKLNKAVEPEEEARSIFKVTPFKKGENYLLVKFSSRVLRSVEGFITFTAQ